MENRTYRDSVGQEAWSLDRRNFLKVFTGGIIVFFSLDPSLEAQESRGRGYPSDPNAYLKIGEDGRVTVYTGKIEMGQGVVTSLAQMAADELGVALESIDMVMGDTDLCPTDMGTFGSMSTRFFGPALRAAAAEARAVLLDLGSQQLKAPVQELTVEKGVVSGESRPDPQDDVRASWLPGRRSLAWSIARRCSSPWLSSRSWESRSTAWMPGRRSPERPSTPGTSGSRTCCTPGIVRPPAHGAEVGEGRHLGRRENTGRHPGQRRGSDCRASSGSGNGGKSRCGYQGRIRRP